MNKPEQLFQQSLRSAGRLAMSLVLVGVLGGCERAMQDMYEPSHYRTLGESPLFADGRAARPLMRGTVPVSAEQVPSDHAPFPITAAALARGQQRYDVYCAPCHGLAGYGDGIVAQRGFPDPPSFHKKKLRKAPDSHLYKVITEGHGLMYSYATRVPPLDRWAIIAYIRALQLSRHAKASELPPALRSQLPGDGQ
jgi:mono/diheme cytochrome c family protein